MGQEVGSPYILGLCLNNLGGIKNEVPLHVACDCFDPVLTVQSYRYYVSFVSGVQPCFIFWNKKMVTLQRSKLENLHNFHAIP